MNFDWVMFRKIFIYFNSIIAWILVYMIFIHAWINGGYTLVSINTFGEALIEFVFIPIYLIVLVVFIIKEWKNEI